MKPIWWVLAIAVASSATAHAQTAAPRTTPASTPATDRGYVEGVAQSAFGNVTSQSYGFEFGYTIRPDLQVYGEFGRIRDTADDALTADAAAIAGALSQLQPAGVGFTARRPVIFYGGGIKYRPPTMLRVQPYVLGGFGFGNVKNDVSFTVGGTAVNDSTLSQFVTLGSDLSGSSTNAMLTLGGGVVVPVWHQVILDLQYRYGRIFTEETGISTNRAGVGLGVRF